MTTEDFGSGSLQADGGETDGLSTDGMDHPEPAEDIAFMDSEVQHVDYLLWSHGASNALRARVTAEMKGEKPPDWAVDPEDGGA